MGTVARLGLTLVLVVAAMAVATASAMAQDAVYVKGDDIPLAGPGAGIAVDQSNDDILVARPINGASPGFVERFDSTGASQGTVGSNLAALGVAVAPPDTPNAGNVHVYDAGLFDGTADIHTFTSSGDPVGSPFPVDANLDPNTFVFDPQQIAAGFGLIIYPNAVDDVLDVFDPTGAPAGPALGAGILSDPSDVALGTGTDGPVFYVVDATGGGRVVQLDILGNSSVVSGTTGAVAVATDPARGRLFVGQGSGADFEIVVYDSSGAPIGAFGDGDFAEGNPFPRRIAVNPDSGTVYVSDSGPTPRVAVYEEGAPPPVVTTMSASAVRQTTATFAGTVSQSEVAGIEGCRFEYTDDADHQANGFANADDVPCTAEYPNGGASLVLATANASGLEPNTTYHFRLVASNSGGTGEGGDVVFKTLPNAPTVVTGAAAEVAHTHATLRGTVNPNGGPVTSCEIEFGTTTAYGQSRPCAPAPGGGTSAVGVGANVAGLSAGTIYHFRVRAVNGGGATDGANGTFRTPDRPDPCAADPNSCKPTDQCVVTPAVCKPGPVAMKATVPGRIAVRAGRALIRVSCKGQAGATCKGTLRLRARIDPPGRRKARTLTIGRAQYELAAGKSEVVRVRLSRTARRSLARKGRLRGRVTGPVVSDRSVLFRLRPSD